ncbi:hypothetical protein Poli38472_004718 [Pythium oligandrum]|uniref:J domain-containing protein n=1 Tax=Pythium oligandrum TaxID=41045 RepID=A0A8K1CAB3_PYTOL|nr:hypothetical protein Poli38472_004718 [Pythium oligandrum]|eukprot:TMW59649.1 hypothetical protein Poli38472_004718 [Pythium oligandrum]
MLRVRALLVLLAAALSAVVLLQASPVAAQQQNVSKVRVAAENAFATGDMKKAISLLSKLIELEPKNERNYYKRYRAYLSERKYAHALEDLNASLDVNPKYKQGLLQRGKLHMMIGNCADAAKDFERAIEYYPTEASAKQQLEKSSNCAIYIDEAGRAQSRGDYQSAYAYLTQVLEETAVSSVPLLLERAQLSMSLQNPYDAIADLGSVLKLDGSHIGALLLRGEIFYSIGDKRSLDAAMSHFREGLHSDPEHKGLKKLYRKLKKLLKFVNNAEDEMSRGAYQDAVEDWHSALEVDEGHGAMNKDFWYKLCECELHLKQYAKAQEACQRVLHLDDGYADAHVKLSDALLGLEQYEDAVRAARRAAELDDSNRSYQEAVHRAEAALKQSKNKNYYKILGVSRDASVKEIKKAYRKQALEWHPDKHADKEESERESINKKFHDIAEAYEILSDDETRARYDRGEDVTGNAGQQGGGGHPFHHPFGNSHFFQQGGRTFQFNFGGGF